MEISNTAYDFVSLIGSITAIIASCSRFERTVHWQKSATALQQQLDNNLQPNPGLYRAIIGKTCKVYDHIKSNLQHFSKDIHGPKFKEFNSLALQFKKIRSHYECKSTKEILECAHCANELIEDTTNETLICVGCGIVNTVIFEEITPVRPKEISNRNNNHLYTWIDSIEGHGIEHVPISLIRFIRNKIAENGIIFLRVNTIRSLMEEYQRFLKRGSSDEKVNAYYKLAPAVLAKITDIPAEKFTSEERDQIEHYFGLVSALIGDQIKYFPFYIYKIIEHVLRTNEDRKNYFLSMIVLQAQTTNEKNDKIWETVCERVGIPFRPT